MAEEQQNTNSESAADLNRRQFFAKLGLGSLSIAAAGTAAFTYQYLQPNVLYEPSPVVNQGKPDRYPLDSVTLDVNAGIYIIHSQEGFFSLSAVCSMFKPTPIISRDTRSKAPLPVRCPGSVYGSMTTATFWSIVPPMSRR
jgi:hypothetical protein